MQPVPAFLFVIYLLCLGSNCFSYRLIVYVGTKCCLILFVTEILFSVTDLGSSPRQRVLPPVFQVFESCHNRLRLGNVVSTKTELGLNIFLLSCVSSQSFLLTEGIFETIPNFLRPLRCQHGIHITCA